MEKQKGVFKRWSPKNQSICLDLGEGENWYNINDTVQNFIKKIKYETEVEVRFGDNNTVTYIQEVGSSIGSNGSNAKNNHDADLIGQSTKRMSALKNATNIAIAKGGDAINDEAILIMAQKFLVFLGN